ncbi:nucleotide pyrophosphatase [Paraoerskovia sediminicola]|uniref:Nucleotide pyrophosphatase n=1 Tax=Paraoerskovia sediminicola TaxID=1138587 RepID=A0ABM8G5I6_9CELL|nr:nucleotide pyrophosphatase/phosphodiesterase family protein [Paraoerskovia sediminicola]BDZ43366.1 nucleotide pyrophosphatase [Paraoerskovia sediminicola]
MTGVPGAAAVLGDLPDDLVAPSYDGRSLASVLPAAAGALGIDLTPGGRSREAQRSLGLPDVERVCVVLVDGLGHDNLAERAGHAPFLRSLLAGSEPLLSSFPSTTAAAMGTFGTGTCPGRTGMLGYTQRDAETGALANMVSWDGAGEPESLQREATVLQGVASAGLGVTSVGPRRFAGSGMTRAALRGGTYVAAESLPGRVDAVVRALREPGLAYLYWGDVDKVGHHRGWGSWQWGDALEALDRELADLSRRLPRGTLLLVTADHGMIDVDLTERWDVAAEPELSRGVQMVAGEPRATHLYVASDDVAQVRERWTQVLGDAALVVTRDEAVAAGWFGPVSAHVREVPGDVVVAMRRRATVVDSASQSAASLTLTGVHGSLTRTEMRVPFLTSQS